MGISILWQSRKVIKEFLEVPISGCIVQLLGKIYSITQTIIILGNTTLEGTISGPVYDTDSVPSKKGSKIVMTGNSNMVSIQSTGNTSLGQIDCYRFALRNLALYTSGTGDVISIFATTTLMPRVGVFENIIISHANSSPGYSVKIAGGVYLRFEKMHLCYGKGVLFANTIAEQEFIWMRQISFASNNLTSCIEINQGHNIYLTEIDVNDSQIGVLLRAANNNSLYDIFMNRIIAVRCEKGFVFNAESGYINRIKVLDSAVFLKNMTGSIAIEFRKNGSFFTSSSVFDTIFIDKAGGSGHFTINDIGQSVTNCHFLNFRIPGGETFFCTLGVSGQNNELNFVNFQKSNVVLASGSGTTRTVNLVSANSPFPAKPVIIVNTNQKSPLVLPQQMLSEAFASYRLNLQLLLLEVFMYPIRLQVIIIMYSKIV